MNIEGGTIAAGGGGSSVGGVGVSAGPAVGVGIGSTIINEGPVAPAFLENTMPLTFNSLKPLGEIIFNPFKGGDSPKSSVLEQAEEVAAVAWEASEASRPGLAVNSIVRTPELAVIKLPNPIINLFGAPKVDIAPQSIVQKRAESRATNAVARATSTLTQSQVQVEQVVEERKMVTERKQDDKPQAKKNEKQSLAKIKIVEAVRVTQLRRLAIFEAVKKVKEEAEKLGEKVVITGKKLKKFLSGEFWKYISPLIGGKGYDGTIPLTLNAIENNQREYTSLEQAQTELSKPVSEHIPLEKGENGRGATWGEVREVTEGREKEPLTVHTPAEIVVRGVVIKNVEVIKSGQVVNTVVEEKEEVAGEPTLKSLGLEEVFKKAA